MCGIAGGVGVAQADVRRAVAALRHRGPDADGVLDIDGVVLGHARLAILDLDPRSNQPFVRGQVALAYNGECWNYRDLRAKLEREGELFLTEGDTEVVAAALDRWGRNALPRIEGMFALAWTTGNGTVHLARDRYGEVPLHVAGGPGHAAFASEERGLRAMGFGRGQLVEPGSVVTLAGGYVGSARWHEDDLTPLDVTLDQAAVELRALIERGCRERAIADVPVCTLLSGGIDSAAIAHGLAACLPGLVAYVAVLDPRSRDLRCAREVADELNLDLVEVPVDPPDADDLRRTIAAIEMPFKAQVEIGWACLALARRANADGFKVVFSGEGSDELWASYAFSYHALAAGENWHEYRHDLFVGQHRKNFARCNKAFMTAGVECRLPFLHSPLAAFALRLPRAAVQDGRTKPKAVIQRAYQGALPESVVNRPKLAFQDGLGLKPLAAAAAGGNPTGFYRREYASLA